jgi:sugar phosphate permease
MNITKFHVHRIFLTIVSFLCYTFVFFNQLAPAILSKHLVQYFQRDSTDLAIFSSMFFWPYALCQPFGGLLADIIDPKYLLIFSCIGSGIGSLICGLSKSFALTIFARFLTGLSCAPCYVPNMRLISRWYSAQFFPIGTGILIASGSMGGILARFPLAAFSDIFGFKAAFYVITCVNFTLGILVFFIVRGDPSKFGYDPIHPLQSTTLTAKQNCQLLFSNLKAVLSQRYIYCCAGFAFFCVSILSNFSSYWGGPYIRDVHPNSSDSLLLTAGSIAAICSSLVLPHISNLLDTRKYMLIGAASINFCIYLMFVFTHEYLNFTLLFIFFFIFGFVIAGNVAVVATYLKELYGPKIAASSIGLMNMCTSLGITVHQQIVAGILRNFEKIGNKYPANGYRYSL